MSVFLCVLICRRVTVSLFKTEDSSSVHQQKKITQGYLRNTYREMYRKLTIVGQYEENFVEVAELQQKRFKSVNHQRILSHCDHPPKPT